MDADARRFRRFLRQEAGLSWWEVWRAVRAQAHNWRQFRPELARVICSAQRLLELGAGSGVFTRRLLRELLRPSQSLVCVDRETHSLTRLAADFPGRLTVLQADLCHLPATLAGFDVVVTHLALHDLELNRSTPEEAFAGFAACLAPRGRLVLIDKVLDGVAALPPEALAERLLTEVAELRGQAIFGLHRLDDYLSLVAEAGLTAVRAAIIGRDPGPCPSSVIEAYLVRNRQQWIESCPEQGRGMAGKLIDEALAAARQAPVRALPVALVVAERVE